MESGGTGLSFPDHQVSSYGLTIPSKEVESEQTSVVQVIRLDALDGLRGIAALWIMFFHCFIYSTYPIDFQGSSLMPLFFLLTGLTLAFVYNRICPSDDELLQAGAERSAKNSTFGFYNNRAIRVAPVYFLMNFALALPLWYYGYGGGPWSSIAYNIGVTATFTSTIFAFILGSPLDGPSWTVGTFVWLWAFFPYSMRSARAMPAPTLMLHIKLMYYVQLVIVAVVFLAALVTIGFWPALAGATMSPVTRFPLFLMGVYAGELLNRASRHRVDLGALWPPSICGLPVCGSWRCDGELVNQPEVFWTRKANRLAIWLPLVTLAVTCLDWLNRSSGGGGILGAVWFQALLPFAQLEFIVALAFTSDDSLLYHGLTTRVAKFFGAISMTVYLTHFPIIYYVCFANNGFTALSWPPSNLSESDPIVTAWQHQRELPLWGIPIVGALTIAISTAVFYGFEEPIRRWFKK